MQTNSVLHAPAHKQTGNQSSGLPFNGADVVVTYHGSVVGFLPLTPNGKEWFAENVAAEGWQYIGSTLYVDHRPAESLIAALTDNGLTIAY